MKERSIREYYIFAILLSSRCASVDANYTVGVDPNAYTDPKESSIPLNVADKVSGVPLISIWLWYKFE